MTGEVIIVNENLYLSYAFLNESGVSKRTVWKWLERSTISTYKVGRKTFACYSTIPTPTRAKLPTEAELLAIYNNDKKDFVFDSLFQTLQYHQLHKNASFLKKYREVYSLDAKQALQKAMKAAVWQRILELHKEHSTGSKQGLGKGIGNALMNAFNRLYPGSYSCMPSFSRVLKTVAERTPLDYCVDGRLLKNKEQPKNKRYNDVHHVMLISFYSSGKKNRAPQILRQMQTGCKKLNITCPALTWVKTNMAALELNPSLYKARYGALATDKILPTMDLLPATYAGDQYQVDGFVMPFLYQHKTDTGKISYKRPVLTAVFDNYSKKVVGYAITISESREALFEALENTVKNTGGLAFEIVSDNHSFNQTKEVINFKESIENLGVKWTVSSNPRQKIVAESSFKYLSESFCKPHAGYLGLAITTKGKNSRPSQEEIDKYLKADNRLTFDEIKAIGVQICEAWNKEQAPGRTNTPNNLWNNCQKPHLRKIDDMDRMRLFIRSTSYIVDKYEINMKIAGISYSYILKADFSHYNRKKVVARYESFDEIYLFEPVNDAFICSVKLKKKAHSALANHTPEDTDIRNHQTALRKAVMTRGEKQVIDMVDRAEQQQPGLRSLLNEMNTPKDIVQLAQEDDDLAMALRSNGIDVNRLEVKKKTSDLTHPAFKQPTKSKKEHSPYYDENHVFGEIQRDI